MKPPRSEITQVVYDGQSLQGVNLCARDPQGPSLADLLAMAVGARIGQLWLTDDALGPLGVRGELVADGWTFTATPATPDWIVATSSAGAVDVVIASRNPNNPFAGLEGAHRLASALDRFRCLLGVPWVRSGAVTSDRLLTLVHDSPRGSVLQPAELPPPGQPGARGEQPAGAEHDFGWVPPTIARPGQAEWLHCFDLNCAYLSASASLALPVGSPLKIQGNDADLRMPGWWLVAWPGHVTKWLPDPVTHAAPTDGYVWVTTPTAKLLAELGYLYVEELWAWPEHHRYLEPWARRLREARRELLETTGPRGHACMNAVKAVYRQGIGRLGSTRRAQGDADPLYQPYWRHAVIAQARVNLWRRLAKSPLPPAAVDVDAVWYFTPHQDPAAAAHRANVPLGIGGGQFKVKGAPIEHRAALEYFAGGRTGVTLDKLRRSVL